MQQRQPRVGDIVDDYCPRERRLSDHAVVAMVGDDIRQTRCTTCDTEHEYRQAKIPSVRKKVAVLAPKPPAAMTSIAAPKPADAQAESEPVGASAPTAPDVAEAQPSAAPSAEGPVHRRLIRAVLPRVEGEVPTRQAPEFTMHRAAATPRPAGHGRGQQRQAQGGFGRHGATPGSGAQRFGGARGNSGAPGGRGGNQGGHSGHAGHGGGRHGRPQQGGAQGPRKRH
jgi:translation initiation factor IF-2